MAKYLGIRPTEFLDIELTAPLMQIRPAHVGYCHFDDDAACTRVGHRVFLNLHGLARPVKRGHPSCCHPGHLTRTGRTSLCGRSGRRPILTAHVHISSASDHRMNAYQAYRQTQAETAAPGELVVMLYRGAARFVGTAVDAIEAEKVPAAHNSLVRAHARGRQPGACPGWPARHSRRLRSHGAQASARSPDGRGDNWRLFTTSLRSVRRES